MMIEQERKDEEVVELLDLDAGYPDALPVTVQIPRVFYCLILLAMFSACASVCSVVMMLHLTDIVRRAYEATAPAVFPMEDKEPEEESNVEDPYALPDVIVADSGEPSAKLALDVPEHRPTVGDSGYDLHYPKESTATAQPLQMHIINRSKLATFKEEPTPIHPAGYDPEVERILREIDKVDAGFF